MFKNIVMWIMNNIFHIQTQTTQTELNDNDKFAKTYEQIDDVNFNAIFSNKLANYTVTDSELEVIGDNERAKTLNKMAQSMWHNMKKIVSMSLGYGGVVLVPYVQRGKIYYNKISQDRLTIDMTDGDLITGATILAEKKTIEGTIKNTVYLRWTNYKVDTDKQNITITQVFTDENGKKIPTPDFWKNIQEVQVITGVDRCLFGYIKSPINNRKAGDKYGVPITYGADATILEIKDTMKQLAREYKLKEAFVGVDYTLFNGANKLPDSGLFKKFDMNDNDNSFFVYDPAFRPFFDRLEELYKRLEHEVGTSAGILSELDTQNATATQIKKAMYDTFSLVDDVRTNLERGLEDFFYACNVLANVYNISPMGDYELDYNWTDGLVEDRQEDWTMRLEAESRGIEKKEELRQWLHPEETLEEATKVIEEIQASNPSIEDLLGTNNEIIPQDNKKPLKEQNKSKEEVNNK